MKRRILSLLLALCMVLSLLPATALATEGASTEDAGHESIKITIAGTALWTDITEDVHYAETVCKPSGSSATVTVNDITDEIANGTKSDADWNIMLDYRDSVPVLRLRNMELGSGNASIAKAGISASGTGALDISVEGASTVVTQGADCLYLSMGKVTTISSVGGAKLTLNTKTTGNVYTLNSAGAGGVTLKNANLVANSGTNAVYEGGSIYVKQGDLKVEGGTLTVKTDFNVNVSNALGILVNGGKLIVSDGAKVTVNKTSEKASTSSSFKIDIESYAVETANGIEIAGGSLTVTNIAGKLDKKSTGTGGGTVHHGTIKGPVIYTPAAGDHVAALYNIDAASSEGASTEHTQENMEGYKYISFQYVCGEGNHAFDNDCTTPDTCTKCGTATAEAGHNMTHHAANAATCTEAGTVEYWSCAVCGKNFADEAGNTVLESIVDAAVGHDMTYHEANAATCTEAGTVEYWSCAVCKKNFADEAGNTVLESIVDAAVGHDMTYHAANAATCTEAGTVEYWSCAVCKKNFADEAGNTELDSIVDAAVGHDMTYHAANAATCTEAGTVEYWSCAVCKKNFADAAGNTVLESIVDAAVGHDMTYHEANAATCTEAGTVEYWSCAVCKKNFADAAGNTVLESIVDAADGHTAGEEATCGKAQICIVCKTELKPATGEHTYDDDFDATCNNGCGYVRGVETPVAQNTTTDKKFATLQAAINEAEPGDTVTLLESVEVTAFVRIDKAITLDLGTKSVTRVNGTGIYVTNVEGTVTIKNGSVTASDTAIYVSEANVDIYDCTVINTADAEAVYLDDSGIINIYSGTYKAEQFVRFTLNIDDDDKDNCTIKVHGGKFYNFDPANSASETPAVNFLADKTQHTAQDDEGYFAICGGEVGTELVKGETTHWNTCSGCDAKFNETAHVYENYKSNNDAAIGKNATETGSCACGATHTREIANSALKAVAKVGDTEYASLQEAINKANAGDTVTLLESVEVTAFVRIDKAITLDLGTKSVTRVNGTGIYVTNVEGTVTIMNGSVTASDTAIYVSEANVDIYDCTVINTADAEAVYLDDSGIINIYSGTYKAEQFVRFTLNIDDDDKDNCTIKVHGGKFYNFDPANSASETPAVNFLADKTQHTAQDDEGYFAICGGEVGTELVKGETTHWNTCSGCDAKFNETAHVYENYESNNDAAIGKNATETGSCACGATHTREIANSALKAVAKVGDTEYASLQAAFDAAVDESTIKLLTDVTLKGYLNVTKAGKITLDMNGKSITRVGGTGIYVNNTDIVLTITGNGEINAHQAVYANAGKVIIENGTYHGISDTIYVQNTGKIEIIGGTFSVEKTTHTQDDYCVLNKLDADRETASIVVKGGTFKGFNPENNASEGRGTDFTAEGYIAIDNGDGTYTVREGKWVAQVGEQKFETLADAIAEGGEIKLLADIKLNAFIKVDGTTLVIDLNGNTITRENGNVFYVLNGGKLTAKNGNLVAAADVAIYSAGNGTTKNAITLDAVNISSKHFGVYHNGSYFGADVNISNSIITDTCGTGVYLSGSENWGADKLNTLTITGSTITGATAVEVKFTNATITGSTLTATGAESVNDNNSGTCTSGYAFALTNNGTAITKGVLNLSGNTCNGKVGIKVDTAADVINNGGAIEAPAGYCWNDSGVLGVHEENDGEVTKQPDCTNEGIKTFSCDHCGEIIRTESVEAKGHSFGTDGYCTVCNAENGDATFVAQIGETKYLSLQAAIEAAGKDAEITLLKSVVTDALVIEKNVTINLDGKNLYIKQTDGATAAVTIASGATVSFIDGDVRISGTNSYATLIENNGTLTLNNVIVRGTALGSENSVALYNKGTVTITGSSIVLAKDMAKTNTAIVNEGECTIDIDKIEAVDARVQGVIDQISGKLTLTTVKLTGKLAYTDGEVTRSSDAVIVSAPDCCWNGNVLGKHEAAEGEHDCAHCSGKVSSHNYVNGYCSVCGLKNENATFVAETGDKQYTTLEEAIANANGGTVKLRKSVVTDALVIEKNVTINLDGKNLYIKQTDGATAAVTIASGATVSFIDGDVRINGTNSYATLIENNGTLTLNNVIVRGTALGSENSVALYNKGTVTITGSSIVLAKDMAKTNTAIVNEGISCTIVLIKTETVDARVQGVIKTVENGFSMEGKLTGKTEIIEVN